MSVIRHGKKDSRLLVGIFFLLLIPVLMSACATHKVPDKGSQAVARKKPPVKKSAGYYRVRKGDSLYSIAWRAGVDYRTLARWNGLKSPYTIYPGQKIRLSPPKKAKTQRLPSGKTSRKPVTKATTAKTNKGKTPTKSAKSTASTTKPAPRKPTKKAATGSLRWKWPVRGRLLSRFAANDPARGGIKIGGRKGQKIVAAESGQVVYVGSGLIGYGQLIIIKHNNKYLSAYGHNSRLLVKEGDKVSRGQHISDMGVTNQGTPLLYFEIRRYGKPVDPMKYLPR